MESVSLNDKQKEYLESSLCLVNKILKSHEQKSCKNYQKKVFAKDPSVCSAFSDKELEFIHDFKNKKIAEFGNKTCEIAILESYNGMLYTLCKKYKGNHEIDDFMQEAKLVFLKAMYSWDSDKASLCTFVYNCSKNALLTYRKKLGPSLSNHVELSEDSKQTIQSFTLDAKEYLNHIINSANLDESEKKLIACFLDGKVGWRSKIAEENNVTRQAVSFKFNNLLKRLKEVNS
jgi:RNA polymerase sigma factor (sigma-70 family)